MSFTNQQARALIRKAVNRVPEGEEIRHLNIMPMMDMMTILLVAFIAQASVSTTVVASAVELPQSPSMEILPESATAIIITPAAVVIDGVPVVAVQNGDVDAAQRDAGVQGVTIPVVTKFLGAFREAETARLKLAGKEVPPIPELFIIADRSIPYRLIYAVLASARHPGAGYKRFRFIVEEFSPTGP